MVDVGGTDLNTNTYGFRSLCSEVAEALGDPAMEIHPPAQYERKVNLAQALVCLRLRVLTKFKEDLTIAAETRSVNIYSDWAIKDFLAIMRLWIDDYPCFPLSHGMDDLDFVNDMTSSGNSMRYTVESGVIYFEPKNSESYSARMQYVRKPLISTLSAVPGTTASKIELGLEYVSAIRARALMDFANPGSDNYARYGAAYENEIKELEFLKYAVDEG